MVILTFLSMILVGCVKLLSLLTTRAIDSNLKEQPKHPELMDVLTTPLALTLLCFGLQLFVCVNRQWFRNQLETIKTWAKRTMVKTPDVIDSQELVYTGDAVHMKIVTPSGKRLTVRLPMEELSHRLVTNLLAQSPGSQGGYRESKMPHSSFMKCGTWPTSLAVLHSSPGVPLRELGGCACAFRATIHAEGSHDVLVTTLHHWELLPNEFVVRVGDKDSPVYKNQFEQVIRLNGKTDVVFLTPRNSSLWSVLGLKSTKLASGYVGQAITVYTPQGNGISRARGTAKCMGKGMFEFLHSASTLAGASGSPVMNNKGRVIGVHLGTTQDGTSNRAFLMEPFVNAKSVKPYFQRMFESRGVQSKQLRRLERDWQKSQRDEDAQAEIIAYTKGRYLAYLTGLSNFDDSEEDRFVRFCTKHKIGWFHREGDDDDFLEDYFGKREDDEGYTRRFETKTNSVPSLTSTPKVSDEVKYPEQNASGSEQQPPAPVPQATSTPAPMPQASVPTPTPQVAEPQFQEMLKILQAEIKSLKSTINESKEHSAPQQTQTFRPQQVRERLPKPKVSANTNGATTRWRRVSQGSTLKAPQVSLTTKVQRETRRQPPSKPRVAIRDSKSGSGSPVTSQALSPHWSTRLEEEYQESCRQAARLKRLRKKHLKSFPVQFNQHGRYISPTSPTCTTSS
jgi:hypothetical protein